MKLTRRHKTIGIGAAAGIAGAVALAFAVPALADDDATIGINPGNVPTTAEGFEDRSCDQIPGDTADWLDGWVFVLPNSVPAEGNFHYIEAVFQDEDGNVLRYNTADDGGIVDGSGDNKAYIITPAGLTLIDAEATVDLEDGGGNGNGGKEPQFNLTHTCPATEDEPGEETPSEEPTSPTEEPSSPTEEPSSPTEEPSSPTEEPTSPTDETTSPSEEPTSPTEEPTSPTEEPTTSEEPSSPTEEPTTGSEEPSSPTEEPTTESEAPTSATEEPTTPGEETSTEVEASSSPAESSSEPAASNSAPGEASTSPAGSFLPTTGSSLTFVLVAAGALVIAGGVILAFMRRRREPEEG